MKNIDWKNLSFGYVKTDYNVRCYFRNGEWGKLELTSDEYIPMHMAASCLHYGQEAFEGMKAFRGKDGKVRLFRWEENWKRLNNSADTIMLAPIPEKLFFEALEMVIKANAGYIPPYGTEGSLYIRPLLIGTGATIGVKPADEYLFVVFVMPVGPYFKEGFKPTDMQIAKDYDRAAPLGTGHVKVGGNYAASLRAGERAHKEGFSASIFADAKTKTFIDEAGPANSWSKDATSDSMRSTPSRKLAPAVPPPSSPPSTRFRTERPARSMSSPKTANPVPGPSRCARSSWASNMAKSKTSTVGAPSWTAKFHHCCYKRGCCHGILFLLYG